MDGRANLAGFIFIFIFKCKSRLLHVYYFFQPVSLCIKVKCESFPGFDLRRRLFPTLAYNSHRQSNLYSEKAFCSTNVRWIRCENLFGEKWFIDLFFRSPDLLDRPHRFSGQFAPVDFRTPLPITARRTAVRASKRSYLLPFDFYDIWRYISCASRPYKLATYLCLRTLSNFHGKLLTPSMRYRVFSIRNFLGRSMWYIVVSYNNNYILNTHWKSYFICVMMNIRLMNMYSEMQRVK